MYNEQLAEGLSWQTDKKRILNSMKRQWANNFFLNLCRHMVFPDCYTLQPRIEIQWLLNDTKPVAISPGDSVGGTAEQKYL